MELEADVVTIAVTLFLLVILMAFFFGDWFSLRRIFGDMAGRDVEVTGAMSTTLGTYDGSAGENFFRLCILILDYASKVLQGVLQEELEKKYPGLELYKVLDDKTVRNKLFNLKRVFNRQQQQQLYPDGKNGNPSTSVTVGDLDLTLTVLLLRNITKLDTKTKAWDNPSDSDTSIEAEIGRVKRYRNVDYGHINEAAISLDVFREKFSGLKSSLLALSDRYSGEEYDAILRKPLDDGLLRDYQDVMKKLCQYDKEVKEWMMENHDMLKEIGLRTIGTHEMVQVLYDRVQDRSERQISPGSQSRSSSQSESDDSPVPSTSRSDQKSGRHHKQRAKSGSKLNPATITADARDQALEKSPTESRNKEIAEFYIKYMSEIQRFPWDPNDTMDIDVVYVNLEWIQEKKKPAGTSFDRIQGYTSIFNDTKQGKTPKRILVRGKAGIGKTTFTQKMATDWANAILGSTTCEGILSNYKYLLILNLRSILPHQTLKKAIEMQIPCSAEKEVIEDIMCALNKDRNKVLLVFDGYDEYDPNTSKEITDIILGRQYPEVCTVITSRPWKAEELMNRRITDGVYEITGLTEDNIHEYVAKFFDDGQAYLELRLKGAFSHSMVESRHAIGKGLVGYLERRKLMSLVKIPILLLFICLMWEGNQTSDTTAVSLPASYTLLYEKLLRLIIRRKNKIEKESEVDKYLEELNDTFLQLGERALCGLLKPGGGLTFDEEDLQSIPDIDELYSLGLLSRSKVHCNFDVKKEVTFLHKTIQDLFAAKYFARTIDNNLDKFLGCFNTLGRLHDMDYVLRFLCGLSETAAIKVLPRANALFGKESKYSSWRIIHTDIDCKYGEWIQNLLLEHWYAHCPYGTVLPPEIIHSAIAWHTELHIPGLFRHSDPRFQRALWDSVDSAFSSPQTCAVTLTDVTKVKVGSDRYIKSNFEEENENSWHKLLSIFKTCYMSEKLEKISWLIESHTCDVCKCALKNVLSKAPYLRTLEIKGYCKGVLASIPNPGNLVDLGARNINDQDIQVIQQMESLQFISVKGDRLSKDPAPVLGTLPNISHDCTYRYIDIGHIYLGAKGVKLLGRNLRHMPKLYHLGLKSVLKRGPECESSRCTCPRGEDTTQCDICKDVCEAVRELSQGVIHTTYLTYFSFRGNHLAVYHGIKDPLTGLMESLGTVSGYAGLNIDMRENGLHNYMNSALFKIKLLKSLNDSLEDSVTN